MTCKNAACQCPHCLDRPGRCFVSIMIGSEEGHPVPLGTIDINVDPFLIQEWMIEKVIIRASKDLSKYASQNPTGKVVN